MGVAPNLIPLSPSSMHISGLCQALLFVCTAFMTPDHPAHQVRQLTHLLRAQGGDSVLAPRVASAVYRHATDQGVDPSLVVAVIAVENRPLKPRARSSAGALGIMQVMPFWRKYLSRQCGSQLTHVETNVCYGIRILKQNIEQASTLRGALLRYNGCVRAPGCHRYPDIVFRHLEAQGGS